METYPYICLKLKNMAETFLTWFFMHIIYVYGVKPLKGFKNKSFSEKKRIALSMRDLD